MIRLTRFNGTEYVLNSNLIETIESTPDTVITTVDGHRYIVTETVDEIINRIIEYKQKINLPRM